MMAEEYINQHLSKVFKVKDWKITDVFLDVEELIKNNYNFWWEYDKKGSILNQIIELAINSKNTQDLIKSNEKLSKSNTRYQLALNILTWALVLVWILQIFGDKIKSFIRPGN